MARQIGPSWNLDHLTRPGKVMGAFIGDKEFPVMMRYHTQCWLSIVHKVYCVSIGIVYTIKAGKAKSRTTG